MQTEELFIRAVRVETWIGDCRCTNASGFFYLDEGMLYLITNRHVVVNEPTGHQPDSLRLLLHTDAKDLTANETVSIPLYDNGVPQWKEHPIHGDAVDIVAVLISDPTMLSVYYLDAFRPIDVLTEQQTLPPGQPVLIVGFPLGFNDTFHNLPIIRQAVVATDFGHPFKGEPYFLTDARMHRGTSGAPVVARIKCATDVAGQFEERWCLLGIHSAALDVSDRDPLQDDRLGLNCTWYARLISEMLHPSPSIEVANQPQFAMAVH
jgi:hypothetical protein